MSSPPPSTNSSIRPVGPLHGSLHYGFDHGDGLTGERIKYVAKSYATTLRKYEELTAVIQGLSQSLSQIITNQENEFIASYRVHMLQVALELKELQSRVEKEEMYNDNVMLHIEEGMNWYKDQSKRLQKEEDALNYEINVLPFIKNSFQPKIHVFFD